MFFQSILREDVLEYLQILINHHNKHIRLNAATLIGNFMACDSKIIEQIFYHKIYELMWEKINDDEHLVIFYYLKKK